jgi:hypothetical protein
MVEKLFLLKKFYSQKIAPEGIEPRPIAPDSGYFTTVPQLQIQIFQLF